VYYCLPGLTAKHRVKQRRRRVARLAQHVPKVRLRTEGESAGLVKQKVLPCAAGPRAAEQSANCDLAMMLPYCYILAS
jgi:hypothetical protein